MVGLVDGPLSNGIQSHYGTQSGKIVKSGESCKSTAAKPSLSRRASSRPSVCRTDQRRKSGALPPRMSDLYPSRAIRPPGRVARLVRLDARVPGCTRGVAEGWGICAGNATDRTRSAACKFMGPRNLAGKENHVPHSPEDGYYKITYGYTVSNKCELSVPSHCSRENQAL